MTKSLSALSVLVLAAFLFTGCVGESKPQVGVVDAAAVFKQCKAGQQAMTYLQEQAKALQEKVQEAQKAAEGNQNEQTMQAFQKAVTEYQTTMGGEQQRLVTLLNDKYTAVLEKYRKDSGLVAILSKEAVMAYDPAADITAKVVEALDKENIDLQLAPKADAAKAEAPKAEAAPAPAEAPKADAPKEEKKP
ncbi:MAG TPA: OmpH family outer membrane protein [Desulfovibrio sp.]|jgi:outer membrane protein|uniref:OmpH family outer membrane protein n=1 Tax=Desulfovibrio TaxID=872 RepID=UPI0004138B85|nr:MULTISPECIES: OmpH family outer membrane protein [Desulfovibrio]MDY0305670.1 OmpH family outer membrane protein [Desulfovibrionaceae bacterium]HMM40062.1 OmpH family outer membrane protein [Desulfovibrio sp.]